MRVKALWDIPGGLKDENMKKGRIREANSTLFGLPKVMFFGDFSLLGAPRHGKREFRESFFGVWIQRRVFRGSSKRKGMFSRG